ncbi:hypothetical protein [Streptomyces sp. SM11]|nr:hypothetical protein [Streptomyces sp. SM11]
MCLLAVLGGATTLAGISRFAVEKLLDTSPNAVQNEAVTMEKVTA